MKMTIKAFVVLLCLCSWAACKQKENIRVASSTERYVAVSDVNPAYFSFSDGSPFIPVGINMINPSGSTANHPDSAFQEIEEWMKNLSDNGGNYIRIWLSQSFWDIEESAGKYSDEKANRIDRFFNLARKYGLRIKVTLEHFRSITLEENPQRWATKFAYHKSNGGPLDSISQYLTSDAGRRLFLNKVDYYQNRYGADTLFFGWELWNEMNAMKGKEDSVFFAWNEVMLDAVKQRFPENLVMQSLGSFDTDNIRDVYRRMMLLKGNEVAQVHRYLDLGAPLEVCHQSMDIICSSAVREIASYNPGKPIILAETGAVEPRHAGPSKYYPLDTAGILLHDILFAPFFSGAAGPGMSWHWESYVHKNNLWFHFSRFRQAIRHINVIDEDFVASIKEGGDLRVYQLTGTKTNLLWIRDKESSWQNELEKRLAPRVLRGKTINVNDFAIKTKPDSVQIYDPWKNEWNTVKTQGDMVELPEFSRSLVLRVQNQPKK